MIEAFCREQERVKTTSQEVLSVVTLAFQQEMLATTATQHTYNSLRKVWIPV
jgi:hypothetical protein